MGKFDALFEDQDDPLLGTPKSKFWDILNTADKDIIQDEFDNFILKFALMEKLLEEQYTEQEIKNKMAEYQLNDSIDLEKEKKSLYMEFTTNIICKLDS